jgi:hypothetical protein
MAWSEKLRNIGVSFKQTNQRIFFHGVLLDMTKANVSSMSICEVLQVHHAVSDLDC